MFTPDLANYTLLLSHEDAAGEIYIVVSDDRLSLRLALKAADISRRHSVKTIKKLLAGKGVVAQINEPLIERMIDSLKEPFSATDYTQIAEGVSPVDGEDGRLQPLFSTQDCAVVKGQELVTVTAPTAGSKGVDVFGAAIPCNPGKASVGVMFGDNVAREPGSNRIIASLDGFALVVGNAVAVSPIFQVNVSADKCQATVSFDDPAASYRELTSLLGSVGIVFGIQSEALKAAIAGKTAVSAMTAAEGVKPVEGKDASVEFFFARKPNWKTIDRMHWRVQRKNILAMFEPKEPLLRLKPAVPGTPGKNILGGEIPVRAVIDVTVLPGENVVQEKTDDGLVFSGRKRGAPVLHGNILNLVDEYVIAGDVHPDDGDIQFGGNIVINGNALNGTNIYSEKDIVIKGTVYDATLKADGNITVLSGITGARTGKIICGGNLTAKYIGNSCVEANGSVLIANEIITSDVYALGMVSCAAGAIYGGEIVALKGVEAKEVGNANYVRTVVAPGRDYTLALAVKLLDIEMASLKEEQLVINELLQYYKDNPESRAYMSVQQRAVVKAQLLRLTEIVKQMGENEQKVKELKQIEAAAGIKEIKIAKGIYPGVRVEMGHLSRDIAEEIARPLKIVCGDENISFASL